MSGIKIISTMGHIDGIINNAGIIQLFVGIKDMKLNQIDRVMNVNFYGTLYMTKAFPDHFMKRPEAHIVNIASMGGFLPVPGQSAYGASKAAELIIDGMEKNKRRFFIGKDSKLMNFLYSFTPRFATNIIKHALDGAAL